MMKLLLRREVQSTSGSAPETWLRHIALTALVLIIVFTVSIPCIVFGENDGTADSRLLVDSTMSIAEICYECGFNNLSNFNRIFKKKKECSPKEFRENYRKKKKLV